MCNTSSGTLTYSGLPAKPDPFNIRQRALELACRVVLPGDPPGHFLSTAREFESYLSTGLTQTGPRFKRGIQIGDENVSVLVDAEGLTPAQSARIRAAVMGVL